MLGIIKSHRKEGGEDTKEVQRYVATALINLSLGLGSYGTHVPRPQTSPRRHRGQRKSEQMGRSDVESLTEKLARSNLSQEEFWQIGIFLTQIAFDQMITRHHGVGHCGEVPVIAELPRASLER